MASPAEDRLSPKTQSTGSHIGLGLLF